MKWFGSGWRGEGGPRGASGHKTKPPIGQTCKTCGHEIILGEKGWIVPSYWTNSVGEKVRRKNDDVYHKNCLPKREKPEKPKPQPEEAPMAMPLVAAPVSDGAAHHVESPPPPSSSKRPVEVEEQPPAMPAMPPPRPPKRGEIAELFRELGDVSKMSDGGIALEAKRRGLFLTEQQVYMGRYHANHANREEERRVEPQQPRPEQEKPMRRNRALDELLDRNPTATRVWNYLREYFAKHAEGPPNGATIAKACKTTAMGVSSSTRFLREAKAISMEKGKYASIRILSGAGAGSAPSAATSKPNKKVEALGTKGLIVEIEALIAKLEAQRDEEIESSKTLIEAKYAGKIDKLRGTVEALAE